MSARRVGGATSWVVAFPESVRSRAGLPAGRRLLAGSVGRRARPARGLIGGARGCLNPPPPPCHRLPNSIDIYPRISPRDAFGTERRAGRGDEGRRGPARGPQSPPAGTRPWPGGAQIRPGPPHAAGGGGRGAAPPSDRMRKVLFTAGEAPTRSPHLPPRGTGSDKEMSAAPAPQKKGRQRGERGGRSPAPGGRHT